MNDIEEHIDARGEEEIITQEIPDLTDTLWFLWTPWRLDLGKLWFLDMAEKVTRAYLKWLMKRTGHKVTFWVRMDEHFYLLQCVRSVNCPAHVIWKAEDQRLGYAVRKHTAVKCG